MQKINPNNALISLYTVSQRLAIVALKLSARLFHIKHRFYKTMAWVIGLDENPMILRVFTSSSLPSPVSIYIRFLLRPVCAFVVFCTSNSTEAT